MKRHGLTYGACCALALALMAGGALAQTREKAADDNRGLAVLDAYDALEAVGQEDAARAEAEARLATACVRFGYRDIETCIAIAQNEKWVAMGGQGCVITAGRAWGCRPGAFAQPPSARSAESP